MYRFQRFEWDPFPRKSIRVAIIHSVFAYLFWGLVIARGELTKWSKGGVEDVGGVLRLPGVSSNGDLLFQFDTDSKPSMAPFPLVIYPFSHNHLRHALGQHYTNLTRKLWIGPKVNWEQTNGFYLVSPTTWVLLQITASIKSMNLLIQY